jgi:hypothetical protein
MEYPSGMNTIRFTRPNDAEEGVIRRVYFYLDCTGHIMPWPLHRLFAHDDQPTPRFAFQGTVGGDVRQGLDSGASATWNAEALKRKSRARRTARSAE